MFSRIKQFLPGSSRSLHTMHEEITQMHKELAQMRKEFERLYDRIEIADHGINGNIDFKFEERVLPKMKQLSDNLQAHDSHMKMFAWEQFRNNGETLVDAKKRFFLRSPKQREACAYSKSGAQNCSKNSMGFANSPAFLIGWTMAPYSGLYAIRVSSPGMTMLISA